MRACAEASWPSVREHSRVEVRVNRLRPHVDCVALHLRPLVQLPGRGRRTAGTLLSMAASSLTGLGREAV